MPTLSVDENINRLQNSIEQMTQEIFRMQGMIKIFMDLKTAGVNNIELPSQGLEKIEEESTQENPE